MSAFQQPTVSSQDTLLMEVTALQQDIETLQEEKKDLEIILELTTEHVDRLSEELEEILNVVVSTGIALSAEKNHDLLLERILLAAKSLCNADAGTLYLREGNALNFAIIRNDSLNLALRGTSDAEGSFPPMMLYDETTGQPNYHHVVSCVALSGEPVNIPDVAAAEGFDFSDTKACDARTGYCSTFFLTLPLKNHAPDIVETRV